MAEREQARLAAQLKNLDEQRVEGMEVPSPELGERAEVRVFPAREDAEGDVRLTVRGDLARAHDPDTVAVEQHREKHLRMVAGRAAAVLVALANDGEMQL